ncbi:MAG: orotate phosphoribosyltransferase [Candidatus Korobacteraceae bacterium]|jgi:orotate phosphoribosyltransferase
MSASGVFLDRELIQERTAKMLLEVRAVQFSASNPFFFTSGWASPVYIDCRKLISYPHLRQTVIDFATSTIIREIGVECVDGVAGGETAGIPFAAWIADRLILPMQYIRKKPQGFGLNAQIEGDLRGSKRTLLVEDLTTDARSKVMFCKALREAGAIVEHAFVVFHYGIYPDSSKTMAEIGVTLHALATWWDILRVAKGGDYLAPAALDEVEKFLHDPISWSAEHGGVSQVLRQDER